jgi:hypothetical protein
MANENFPDIALMDGTPPKLASNAGGGAKNVTSIGTLAAATPVTGGTVTVARIPVDSKITSIMLANDDLGTAAPADLGFYVGGSAGATAVDVDAMGSAIALGTATTTWTEYRFEAANINTADMPAWELAGLSERPAYGTFDIVLTYGTINTGASGDISYKLEIIQ